MGVRRICAQYALQIGANIKDREGAVTLVHLGRGGVEKDGTLNPYNQYRVGAVLRIARQLNKYFPKLRVTIIWTGKCNRAQDRSGLKLSGTEAGAAMTYAQTQLEPGDTFIMETEEESTSTVENAILTARNFSVKGPLVVMTDSLHYMGGKIKLIMMTVFPWCELMFIELPNHEGVTSKEKLHQLISAVTTRAGMAFVTKGDLIAIERRQKWMEKWLERLFRP